MWKTAVVLIVFITLVPSVGCLPVDEPERIREAKQEVLRLGGTVGENGVDGSIIHISLEGCDVSSADWGKILPLQRLIWLQLNATETKDDDLRHLQGCSSLETLELNFTDVTDEGLEALIDLPRLERLLLEGCLITDDAVKPLKKMDALAVILLTETYVTQQGFDEIGESVEDMSWRLWSTVQSEEVRQAMVALERGHCHTHSTSAFARYDMLDRIRYEVDLSPKTQLDNDVLSDCLNTLANAGDLDLRLDGDRFISLLPSIKPIDHIRIFPAENGTQLDPGRLNLVSQVEAKNVQIAVPNLPSRSLTELTNVGGMRRLELRNQKITPETWRAMIEAPELETLALYDCEYDEVERFVTASRPLNLDFSDVDSAPKAVRDRITALATPK